MMCDYLNLRNTDEDLFQAGADAWAECCIRSPDVAEAYRNCEWVYPLLDSAGVPHSEIKKIFIKLKEVIDRGLILVSYPYFLHQFTELAKAVAPNAPELSSEGFLLLCACGDQVKASPELDALAFNLN